MKSLRAVICLLFASGMCALVYQLTWLRELRLIFGTSTAASAAVLGVFMGGIGLGSIVLGRRADRAARPLALYGKLELWIAVTAALSPLLVALVRHAYIATGGTMAWGQGAGTIIRLLLAAVVLGAPTFLMGGTLPAAAKAVSRDDDHGRRALAFLYGANALGAVTGVGLATFFLFERFGTLMTLGIACAVNLLVGLLALVVARFAPEPAPETQGKQKKQPSAAEMAPVSPRPFVLAAAATTGFAFMLLEMVWYRMLSPLLGGSTFTFGLILAAALLGVGLGGAAYALVGQNRPATLHGFALTCTVEAFFVALPFALGDRLAVLTALLQPLGLIGFSGQVLAWSVIAGLVVVPAAFIAGVQFPALISLLGRGGRDAGAHTGRAYAWNMAGAITGSLAGGFGLLPLLTAPRTWQLVAALLVLLGLVAVVLSWRKERQPARLFLPFGTAVAALALLFAVGPTAVWRHSPIGAGRTNLVKMKSRNELRAWVNLTRQGILWQADGVESSVGVANDDSFAFMVNGKSDGNARNDAGTQVMLGLIGALLHPNPKQALVVGLGTGSSAGWLAAIPSMEKVDVVELEPAILRLARDCGAVNHDAMKNPKVHVHLGDAREVILTNREQYDIIASEPSNPYRAGVASLFTREFYTAAAARLREDGHFCQWVQAYEVDSETIRTIYTTLLSAFPLVETWQTKTGDLCFVASKLPVNYDAETLRARIRQEPFRSALAQVWRVTTLEGVLARYVADESVARSLADSPGARINTDDGNFLEYAFARTVGRDKNFMIDHLLLAAQRRGVDLPAGLVANIDHDLVQLGRSTAVTAEGLPPRDNPALSAEMKRRAEIQLLYYEADYGEVKNRWFAEPREPADFAELSVAAQALAYNKDERAIEYAAQLREFFPGEAAAIVGILRWQQDRLEEATDALEAAFQAWRTDPWALPGVASRTLDVAFAIATEEKDERHLLAIRLYRVLGEPFATFVDNNRRLSTQINLAQRIEINQQPRPLLVAALHGIEPNVPWAQDFLSMRAAAYRAIADPRTAQAEADLDLFMRNDAQPHLQKSGGDAPARNAVPAETATPTAQPPIGLSAS
jgi:predicted membrane-bound spermidine synthase